MAWDDAPPTPQELAAATPKWDEAPPTPAELGHEEPVSTARQWGRAAIDAIPPTLGAVGGILGAGAGLAEGIPTAGTASLPLAAVQGIGGSAFGYATGNALKDTINAYVDPERAPKSVAENFKNVAMGIPEGAMQEVGGQVIGAGVGMAAKQAGKMAPELAEYLAAKAGKVANNIPEENTKEYLARQGDIEARPSKEIMDELSGHYNESQNSLNNAKSAVEDAEKQAAQATETVKDRFGDERVNAAHDLGEARANLDRAHEAQIDQLKATKGPVDLADDVVASREALKKKLSNASGESYDILDNDPNAYSVRGGAQVLRQMADEMNVKPFVTPGTPPGSVFKSGYEGQTPEMAGLGTQMGGQALGKESPPITAQARAVQGELRNFADRLEQTPEYVSASSLKGMLQDIDASEMAAYNQPGYDSRVSRAYKTIRATIDGVLKEQNKPYAEKMQTEVAPLRQLLEDTVNQFGDKQGTINTLNSIGSNTAGPARQTLKALGDVTDADLTTPVNQYMQNQALLKSQPARQALKESLPEYANFQRAQARAAKVLPSEARANLANEPSVVAANNNLGAAQSTLDQAADRAQQLRSLNPQTVQAKVKALTGARNYGAENTFADVDAATGKQYSKEIKDRAILDSFQKGDTNGARKTMLGTAVGSGVGFLTGGAHGAAIGAAAGSAVGQVADRYAGQAFKAALDTGIGISKFSKALGPYAKVLTDAAARGGPQAVAASHYILQQKDENYRKRVDAINSAGQ